MKENKKQGFILFILMLLWGFLLPINVKADENVYDVALKFYRMPKNEDGTLGMNVDDWLFGVFADNEVVAEELTGDNITINPGDYIAVAPIVKTTGTANAAAITLYYSFDPEIFESTNTDKYLFLETSRNGGTFPGNRSTNWVQVANEINTTLNMGIFSVKDGGGSAMVAYSNTEDIPMGVHVYKVKESAPEGKVADFNFINSIADSTETQIVDASENVVPATYNNSSLIRVFGEPASPSTLSGIEITNSLVPVPFPLNPLNNPFDSSVVNYSITVPNKADNVSIKLLTSSADTVITSTSGTVTKIDGGYTIDVTGLVPTTDESTINTVTFMVMDPAASGEAVTPKTYTIAITRVDNNTAFNLSLEGIAASDITYLPATKTYIATTTNDTTKITATATNGESALTLKNGDTVEATNKIGDGTVSPDGIIGPSWSLTNGANTRTIVAEGANCQNKYSSVPGIGCTTETYTVLITKISTDARLGSLEVTSKNASGNPTTGTLSPAYNLNDPEGTEYTYTYPEGTTTITLNGTVNVPGANITIGTGDYTLSPTVTSGTITVTAQDGVTTRNYKVNFVKELSTDSSLASLTVKTTDGTVLFPTSENPFNKDSESQVYNVLLPNNVTSVKLEAVASKASSTVEGTGTFTIDGFTTVTKIVKVTAENASTTNYTVNFTRQMSSNANATSIKINNDVIPISSFDSENNSYTYPTSLKGNVTSVSVDATFEEPTASIESVSGNSPLVDGVNRINIKTKAQDGTTKTYTVFVTRLSNDTRITGLSVTSNPLGSMNISFNENVRTYTYTYDETVGSINITPTLKDNQTLVSGGGSYNPSEVSQAVITVRAQDGTEGSYTVNFSRQSSNDASLKSLTVLRKNETESFNLTPGFSPDVTEYDLILPHEIRFVTLVAEAKSDHARISENGRMENVEIVQFSHDNPVIRQFTVTAENGSTKTYVVRISRQKSSDASLTNITINGTTIETSDFNSNLEYRLDPVKSDIASLDISAWTLRDEYVLDSGHIESHGTVRILNNTLVEGQDNTVTIKVTSQDERVTKNYKLLVRRMSSYNKLNNLDITTTPEGKGYLDGTFDPDTLTYTYKYDRSVNNININAIVDSTKGSRVISGGGDYPIPENNQAVIVIGAEDHDVAHKTYKVNFEQIIETDNTLKSLSVLNGETLLNLSPSFDPGTLEYNVSVPADATSITINAEKNNTYATDPVGTGVKTVNYGGNRFEVSVTSESGATKTYVINVNRPVSTNAKLSDLKVDGTTVEGFDPDTGTYKLAVSYATNSIDISAIKSVTTSTISGDVGSQNLSVGDNNFQVVVTAEDGTTKGYYNLTIRRKSNDSSIDDLRSSAGVVTKLDDTHYKIDVPSGINTINLNPVTHHPNAKVANPQALNNLSVLNPNVTFDVLAEDELADYKTTYNVQINIIKKSNNFLSSLTTDIGTFNTQFIKTTNDYIVTVDSEATKILISAQAEDPSATVTGDTGEHNLAYGDNYYSITVVAEDDSRNTYNVKVVRPYKNILSLAYLNLNGILIEGFTNDKINYTVTVPYDTNNITLDAQALDHPDATVTGSGLGTHEFTTNRETYTFVVTSHANQVQAYTVTVIRGINTDLNLTNISVANYSLDKEFDSRTSTYSIGDVLDSVPFLTVLAQTSNTDATITYRLDENENSVSNVLALDDSVSLGEHTIVIVLRVGENVNTYYINFTRVSSGLKRIVSAKKPGSEDDIHTIDELYILNNRPDVTINDYKDEFANENDELFVYNADGTLVDSTTSVATGMIMKLERNGELLDQKQIVIMGETTADGLINVADAFRVIQHSLGNDPLTGAYLVAAETTSDETVNVADAFRIIQHSLGNDPFVW